MFYGSLPGFVALETLKGTVFIMFTAPASEVSSTSSRPKSPKGFFRKFAGSDQHTVDDTKLWDEAEALGAGHVSEWVRGDKVDLVGKVGSVTLFPKSVGHPLFVASLSDGSGRLNVIFMGRNRIPGISPGTRMRVKGRLALWNGEVALFNPVFTLLPHETEH